MSKKKINTRKLVNKIDKRLGKSTKKSEQFYLLRKHSKLVIAKSDEVIDLLDKSGKKQGKTNAELNHIKKWLDNFKIELPKKYSVEVLNQIKFPKGFDINNLPSSIDVGNSKAITDPIVRAINDISLKQDLDGHTTANDPISVRLSDGRKFISSLTKAITAQQPTPAGLTAYEIELLEKISEASVSVDIKTATSWQTIVEADRGFAVVAKNITFSTTVETEILLLRNPTADTLIRIKEVIMSIGKVNLSALFTLYRNPTVITNGTLLPTSNFKDHTVGSVMMAYLLPTTSAYGSIHEAYGAFSGTIIRDNDLAFYVEPLHDLLITIQPSLKNNPFTLNVTYGEEPVPTP